MDTIMMKERMEVTYSNKKEIFSEIRDNIFGNYEIKLSTLKNPKIKEQIRTLKVIQLDNLESFYSYVNYDHYLIFKFKDEYYFCDTELVESLELSSLIKIVDYNQIMRKQKLDKINENTTY